MCKVAIVISEEETTIENRNILPGEIYFINTVYASFPRRSLCGLPGI